MRSSELLSLSSMRQFLDRPIGRQRDCRVNSQRDLQGQADEDIPAASYRHADERGGWYPADRLGRHETQGREGEDEECKVMIRVTRNEGFFGTKPSGDPL